jgi:uncharacterized protein (TIGR00730 family)
MATADEVRQQIREALERYFALEAELQQLEKDRFRVCIFGSARIRPEDPTYKTVHRVAGMLAGLGIDIVTGGGPGLMEAANLAVFEAKKRESRSIGLPIQLPRSQELANRHLDIKSEHKRFSSRLDEFMRLSHAVVVAPGGIGTLLELLYAWQLVQVGMLERRPIVLLDRRLYCGLIDWMKEQLLGRGFVGPHDFDWVHVVDTPEEVLPIIQPELEKFRARQAQKPDGAGRAEEAGRILEKLEQKKAETSQTAPAPSEHQPV